MVNVLKNNKAVLFLVAITVFVAYLAFLPAPFYFDDFYNIVYNPDLVSPFKALTSKAGGIRPLAYLWFYFDKVIFGLNPVLFRLENIVLHVANFFIVFLVLRKLTADFGDENSFLISLFVSTLWVLNPVNSQSVGYIVQRMNEVSTTFVLLGFLFYLNFLEKREKIYVFLFALSFFLSLGFKETGILLIPLCLLHYTFFVDFKKGLKIFAVFLLVGVVLVLFFPPFNKILPLDYLLGKVAKDKGFTFYERFLTAFKVVVDYIIVLLIPLYKNVHLYYSFELVKNPLSLGFLVPFFVLCGIMFFGIFIYKKDRLVSFSIFAFFMLLFPESFILPLDIAYQHRMYLPSIFFFLFVVLLIFKLAEKKKAFFVLTAISVFFLINLFARGIVFSNPSFFYENELRHAPKNCKVYINASKYFLENGELEKAEKILQKGLKLFPNDSKLAMNFGLYLAKIGEFDKAILWYKKALKRDNPFLQEVYWSLAVLFTQKGDVNNARHYLDLLEKAGFNLEKIKMLEEKIKKNYSSGNAVSE